MMFHLTAILDQSYYSRLRCQLMYGVLKRVAGEIPGSQDFGSDFLSLVLQLSSLQSYVRLPKSFSVVRAVANPA